MIAIIGCTVAGALTALLYELVGLAEARRVNVWRIVAGTMAGFAVGAAAMLWQSLS